MFSNISNSLPTQTFRISTFMRRPETLKQRSAAAAADVVSRVRRAVVRASRRPAPRDNLRRETCFRSFSKQLDTIHVKIVHDMFGSTFLHDDSSVTETPSTIYTQLYNTFNVAAPCSPRRRPRLAPGGSAVPSRSL